MKSLIQTLYLSIILGFIAPMTMANDDPQQQMEQTTAHLLAKLQKNYTAYQNDADLLSRLVETEVFKFFDFKRMGRLVLAKHWRSASDTQKTAFVTEFKQLISRTYGMSILQFVDKTVTFKPMTGDVSKKKVTIHSIINNPEGGPSTSLDYSMYKPKDAWLIYDVKVENVSLVINYKSSYSQIISKQGLDALIAQLHAKNNQSK